MTAPISEVISRTHTIQRIPVTPGSVPVDRLARVQFTSQDTFLDNDFDCYAESCALLADADLRPYLQTFGMPVAIMVGEEDQATPAEMARQLHEAIPHSTLTILPGARHLTPIGCRDQISSQLLTVLRRS